MKKCPYCEAQVGAETPCLNHPPVPMSFWPNKPQDGEAVSEIETLLEVLAERAS